MGKPNAFPQEGLVEAEYEPNGCDEADAGSDMIPAKLHVKRHHAEEDEHAERDNFLNHLELHEREGPAIFDKTNSVGRHLQTVFKKRNSPGKQDNKDQRGGIGEKTGTLQFQVTIPGKRHEDIRRQ